MRHIAKWKYPQLREGLVGAWAASQGATGDRLLDRSGCNNHGTLTNMDPGTDWVASGDGLALDFDGVADSVALGSTAILPSGYNYTISGWCRASSQIDTFPIVVAIYNGTSTFGFAIYATNWTVLVDGSGKSGSSKGFAVTAGEWVHVSVTVAGTSSYEMYRNAVAQGTVTGAAGYGVTASFLSTGYLTETYTGQIDDVVVHRRILSQSEIALLATRRGIIYETMPTRYHMRGATGGGGGFKAAWANNRNSILGAVVR